MPDTKPEMQQMQLSTEAQLPLGLLASHSRFGRWLNFGLDLLFPPRCAGCGRVDTVWCARCQAEFEAAPLLEHCVEHPPLSAVTATASHTGKIQQMIWSLKYENASHLAVPLANRLAARLAQLDWTFDMLIPVPLHSIRLLERGYNQSQLLAEHLAELVGQPCIPDALRRQRQTQSQVGLNALERQLNMQEAFTAETALITGKNILIIDDVFTTGATLAACAEAALDSGAVEVYGLTLTAAGA